jgi:hypothetical protein
MKTATYYENHEGDNYRYRLEKTIALLYDYHRQSSTN